MDKIQRIDIAAAFGFAVKAQVQIIKPKTSKKVKIIN